MLLQLQQKGHITHPWLWHSHPKATQSVLHRHDQSKQPCRSRRLTYAVLYRCQGPNGALPSCSNCRRGCEIQCTALAKQPIPPCNGRAKVGKLAYHTEHPCSAAQTPGAPTAALLQKCSSSVQPVRALHKLSTAPSQPDQTTPQITLICRCSAAQRVPGAYHTPLAAQLQHEVKNPCTTLPRQHHALPQLQLTPKHKAHTANKERTSFKQERTSREHHAGTQT
jgi:hypothetical protein